MPEKEIKGIKKFFEEFKAFAMRGNVLDMAVGVVIGGAKNFPKNLALKIIMGLLFLTEYLWNVNNEQRRKP